MGLGGAAQPPYLVVLADAELAAGLLVDAVLGFREVFSDEQAAGLGERNGRPVLATTRDLVSILDVDALARSLARPSSAAAARPEHP
ncbi:MAG: hypothetical protein QM765_36010 [Myxococcales bacterium]